MVLQQLAIHASRHEVMSNIKANYKFLLHGAGGNLKEVYPVCLLFDNGEGDFEFRGGKTQNAKAHCICSLTVRGSFSQYLFLLGNVDVKSGAAEVAAVKPDVTLEMTSDDLTLIVLGKMSPLKGYMGGKIGVKGDWALLKKFMQVVQGQ